MADTFPCTKCGHDVPWELGAADDEPDVCDNCYGKKITRLLDTDAPTHHAMIMTTTKRVTLRVTTKDMGTREVAWVGKDAGHKVERV